MMMNRWKQESGATLLGKGCASPGPHRLIYAHHGYGSCKSAVHRRRGMESKKASKLLILAHRPHSQRFQLPQMTSNDVWTLCDKPGHALSTRPIIGTGIR